MSDSQEPFGGFRTFSPSFGIRRFRRATEPPVPAPLAGATGAGTLLELLALLELPAPAERRERRAAKSITAGIRTIFRLLPTKDTPWD